MCHKTINIGRMAAAALMLLVAVGGMAQGVSRSTGKRERKTDDGPQVTQRMQQRFDDSQQTVSDADRAWMRVIYRNIDLNNDVNAPFYFPEEPVDGQLSLFRTIMQLLADNRLAAYEYLDGRELFTDQNRINVREMLDRYHIYYQQAKGSTDKNPKFTIDESDVPANEVLSYFMVERWEYDTRTNRLRPTVEAICPVLHRAGDFGGEPLKFPMFWVKYSDLRPYLAQQMVFLSDDNNLPTCSLDDFFTMTKYKGEIYKTRNLRNKSMAQLYPDTADRRRAADSIQAQLDNFEQRLWVPDREEVIARSARKSAKANVAQETTETNEAAAAEASPAADEQPRRTTRRGSSAKASKPKAAKAPKSSSSSSSATRSVRRSRR